MDAYSQDFWTEAQWTMVREAVRDEARKQRVAASFLPVHGPLSDDAQTTPLQVFPPIGVGAAGVAPVLEIDDYTTRRLTTLSVHVALRAAQVAEPDLASAIVVFRRAANLIARTEDYLVFQGQLGAAQPPTVPGLQPCSITGGDSFPGLLATALARSGQQAVLRGSLFVPSGPALVRGVSDAISLLEQNGHLGPFALTLGSLLFNTAYSPTASLVLPADRIKPMLDGPLVRSSTVNRVQFDLALGQMRERASGVLVSLGGHLVDLVVGSEIDVQFLQLTTAASPRCIFRVSERFTLRIKQPDALVALA
jgi:uncharacterized linocin/CFP29 family protein